MKELMLFALTMLLATSTFATPKASETSLAKLHNAIKSVQGENNSTDHKIQMVYGGEDISRRPTIVMHTTIA